METRQEFKNVAQSIGSYSLSPSAARALVEARGNIFTIPAEHGSIRTLTTNHSGIHELNPAWSPDGKWIAYLRRPGGIQFVNARMIRGQRSNRSEEHTSELQSR